MPFTGMHPATRTWFERALGTPSAPQAQGWPAIRSGAHTLIAAPTGSGKTLAAFLWAIDELVRDGLAGNLPDATRVLYVSPLKALGNDVEQNLQRPIEGIAAELRARGLPEVALRTAVRSGDTPASRRTALARKPPHVLVTTPESLYIMLTSESGRRVLQTVRTVIVDEIHALVTDRRGAHLALSLERLRALVDAPLTRIGLSATQTPIEEVLRFLVGSAPERLERARIVDCGHRRDVELSIELPRSPLEPVMATEVWTEVYDRLAQLAAGHRTTLVFTNTRRLCERVARHLAERIGEQHVAAHHGSLAREQRLHAEQRLKAGELRVLVATASLELGIDIGSVDLVCQLGTTRSISALWQRVGRSGHSHGALARGRIFPLSQGELIEAVALVNAVRGGKLDRIEVPSAPRDVLAQQVVAAVACEDWTADALYTTVRRAYPYRELSREAFDAVVRMLADGFRTGRGRRGALLYHDRINGQLRARRGARMAAITGGGAIPDTADYRVLLEPGGLTVGTINEDFAIESMAGDVFQLGNRAYRILRVAQGTVRVEDAHGATPTIPFWLGEAPARSWELSGEVAALHGAAAKALDERTQEQSASEAVKAAIAIDDDNVAEELATHLASGYEALGALPDGKHVIVERFFDESGGMQLVLHTGFGGRVNRAWGLALRKRFCRSFNFELQAAATEDSIVLSLGPMHSFELSELRAFLRSALAREVLIQALLDAPMFETRWRWNAGRALAVPRMRGGSKLAAPLRRMLANDLLAAAFPDQQACAENLTGEREIPDHPLVQQTIDDCLHEAMDIDRLEAILGACERGEIELVFRELTEPSPLAREVLSARPYAFLDDAPLEERRTQAVANRRLLRPEDAGRLAALDPEAIARVRNQAWPTYRDADELADALSLLGVMTPEEADRVPEASSWHASLLAERRAARMHVSAERWLWVAADRIAGLRLVYPNAQLEPAIAAPPGTDAPPDEDAALIELVRGRIEALGPVTVSELKAPLALTEAQVRAALGALQAEGSVMCGRYRNDTDDEQWCERGLLARIHRATLDRLRREIEPVSRADFMRFLFRWQRTDGAEPYRGPTGLLAALEQLVGYSAAAGSWELELLPLRVEGYEPEWLDRLCLSGAASWARINPRTSETGRARLSRATPIAIGPRVELAALRSTVAAEEGLSPDAQRVLGLLNERGASFAEELRAHTRLLPTQLDVALGELVARGLAGSDAYAGLRALLIPAQRRGGGRRHAKLDTMEALAAAGRWSRAPVPDASNEAVRARTEAFARALLRRYGVVFRAVLARELGLPPWRDLLRVYRRLEANGEVRGGRFVDGFSGEQYALPEAVSALRSARRAELTGKLIAISAVDPLCLLGIVLPGERVPAVPQARVLLRDGLPVAIRERGHVRHLDPPASEAARWDAEVLLRRRDIPAALRPYVVA